MHATSWIYAAAAYNVALAGFHLCFWKLFRWRDELSRLSPVNRGVMQVLNLMLTYFFVLTAVMLFAWPEAMLLTPAGRCALAGLTGFWVLRAVLQLVFWRELKPVTNWAFVALFLIGAGLHGAPLFLWERW